MKKAKTHNYKLDALLILIITVMAYLVFCGCAAVPSIASLSGVGSTSSTSGQPLSKEQARLESIEKQIKRQSGDVALRLEACSLLQQLRSKAGDDWLNRALLYAQGASEIAPDNMDCRWTVASLSEYSGLYEDAARHYQWILENSPDSNSSQGKARAHLVTCQFMSKLQQQDSLANAPREPGEVEDSSPSGRRLSVRAGLEFLQKVIAVTAVTAGITSLGGDGDHVQVALGYLQDWLDAPSEANVAMRNRMLAGMVSTIASIISERNLAVAVDNALQSHGKGSVDPSVWPEPGFGGELEDEFRNEQPPEGRTIEFGDDYSFTPKWDFPQIAGTYDPDCSTWQCSDPKIPCFPTGKSAWPQGAVTLTVESGPYIVVQNGRSLSLTWLGSHTVQNFYGPDIFTTSGVTASGAIDGNLGKLKGVATSKASDGHAFTFDCVADLEIINNDRVRLTYRVQNIGYSVELIRRGSSQ